jgi:hypothetical protein
VRRREGERQELLFAAVGVIGVFLFLLISVLPLSSAAFAGSLSSLEQAYRECEKMGVPRAVVAAIGVVEGGRRPYPYLIRINTPVRIRAPKGLLKKLPSGAIDCKSELVCKALAEKLIRRGIKNIDLGYYQINYLYAPHNGISRKELLAKAFNLPEETVLACKILARNFKEYGYTAAAIGRYHSAKSRAALQYALKWWRAYKTFTRGEK